MVPLPRYQKELVSLNGGRYAIRAERPSSERGTSAAQWEREKDDGRRRPVDSGTDVGRLMRQTFNGPLMTLGQ